MTRRLLPLLLALAVSLPGTGTTAPAAAQDPPAKGPRDPAAEDAAAVETATKDYVRRLGTTLRVAERGSFVVRGDHDQADLENLAVLAQATFDHYVQSMGCPPEDVLRGTKKYERLKVDIFQFKQEKAYLAFLDKVLARIRDDTVDDKRLALMRRQRGFFILTPKPMIVQHMGPSDFSTVRSQVVHKTSHVLLLSHDRAGAWMPWWLLEGIATWQEFAVLHESRTYCLEVERPGDYARPGTPEADEASKARMEDSWKAKVREMVAAKRQRDLPVLARLSLNELTFDDVMQSWSIVSWLFRERKLATLVKHYKAQRDFAKTCDLTFGAPPSSVDEMWKASVPGGR